MLDKLNYHQLDGDDRHSVCGKSLKSGGDLVSTTTAGEKGRKKVVGVILILISIVTWVAHSEVLQDNEYVTLHPLFIRYLVTSGFCSSAVFAFLLEHCFELRSKQDKKGRNLFLRTASCAFCMGWAIMYAQGWIYNMSIRETTVALNNSLYQTQCIFSYILSVFFHGELLTLRKSSAILIALSGVFLISFGTSTGESQGNTIQGVILCTVAGLWWAVWEVTVKVLEERHYDRDYPYRDSMYYLGYCAFWILVTGPVFLYACHKLMWEHFDLPPDAKAVYQIIKLCVSSGICNISSVLAVTLLTPLQVSFGLLLIVPAGYVADLLLGKLRTVPDPMQISGVILIVAGFLILNLEEFLKPLSGLMHRKITEAERQMICPSINSGQGPLNENVIPLKLPANS